MPYSATPKYWLGSTRPTASQDLESNEKTEYAIKAGECEWPYLLHGPCGTGKTTLMALTVGKIRDAEGGAISKRTRFMWKDRRVIWTQAAEFCRDVKAEIDLSRRFEDFDDNFSASGLAEAVPCLFLDDLGVEQETDYNVDTIATLLDARYRSRRPTWISTNLSVEELGQRYGERTVSRLLEYIRFIGIDGDDRRKILQREIVRTHSNNTNVTAITTYKALACQT